MASKLRFAWIFAATAVAAYLVAGCTTGEGEFYARTEVDETNRNDLALLGQSNCVAEALASLPGPGCPSVPTGKPFPASGILVLDDFYIQPGPGSPGAITEGSLGRGLACFLVAPTSCSGPLSSLVTGTNTARASRGVLPDIIVPGAGRFFAVYGWFNNTNGDDAVSVDDTGRTPSGDVTTGPANEFVRKETGNIVSYVEPGAHPNYDSMTRPSAFEPDIAYVPESFATSRTDYLYGQKSSGGLGTVGVSFWIDGSLLRTVTVTTVTDPIFAPAPDGRPYTPTPTSLVDIDEYVAVAPGSVASLYQTLAGPIMDQWSSPSWGNCPNACVPGPIGLGGTPAAGPGGLAQGLVWAPNLPETRAGSDNSAEGRLADFEQGFRGWVDVIPSMRATFSAWFVPLAWTPSMPLPLSRSIQGDEPTVPPGGFLAPEAWTGVWYDQSRDGRIGHLADPNDPYEGGSRPNPDNYYDSKGEFLGVLPIYPATRENFVLTFTPDTDWGPGGVYQYMASVPTDPTRDSFEECQINGVVVCLGVNSGSTQSFEMTLSTVSPAGGGGWFFPAMPNAKGHYGAFTSIVFPAGSPGFTICTDVLVIEWVEGGVPVRDEVRDCDHFAPWSPA